MREPAFWWRDAGLPAGLLSPVAALYGAVAGRRLAARGRHAAVPVICIGNPTVGGAGKTPLALAVVRLLQAAGEQPALLSRGYGGHLAGPVRVDAALHDAAAVGDEPLLLARSAPTIVARDRVQGAEAAIATGASVIVMDDGFQNPSLQKDFSVLAIDGGRGIGNGRVIPAGPLRAPLDRQLQHAQAVVIVGANTGATAVAAESSSRRIPVLQARLIPDAGFIAALGGGRALAFAGIGDPEKFYATLRDAGVALAATQGFPDHHRYTPAEAQSLCDHADREGLVLVTTEKDAARTQGDAALAGLSSRAHALPVSLAFDDEGSFRSLLLEQVAAARKSRA
jgi:tetraacyldisaccharide 4'-kinase